MKALRSALSLTALALSGALACQSAAGPVKAPTVAELRDRAVSDPQ